MCVSSVYLCVHCGVGVCSVAAVKHPYVRGSTFWKDTLKCTCLKLIVFSFTNSKIQDSRFQFSVSKGCSWRRGNNTHIRHNMAPKLPSRGSINMMDFPKGGVMVYCMR